MKGLIVGGGVDTPLYQVKLIHDTASHDAEVAKAKRLQATAKARKDSEHAKWVAAVFEREQLPVNATDAAIATVQDKIDTAHNQEARYAAIERMATDRIATLAAKKVPDATVDAWCADYTTGLTGEVGLCEQMMPDGAKRYTIYCSQKDSAKTNDIFVNDVVGKQSEANANVDKYAKAVLVDNKLLAQMKAAYDMGSLPKAQAFIDGVNYAFARLQTDLGKLKVAKINAANAQRGVNMVVNYTTRTEAYIALNDGRQVESATMPARTWFINAAREPWRYKWKPQYVKGKVVANDTTASTLDVAVDPLTMGLNKDLIHTELKTTGIPANYMGGDSSLYQVGDEVLVEFPSFNPKLPVVNGFSIAPRPPYLWADSQYIAVDYDRKLAYHYDTNTGYVDVWDTAKSRIVLTVTSPLIPPNNGEPIMIIGCEPQGFFLARRIEMNKSPTVQSPTTRRAELYKSTTIVTNDGFGNISFQDGTSLKVHDGVDVYYDFVGHKSAIVMDPSYSYTRESNYVYNLGVGYFYDTYIETPVQQSARQYISTVSQVGRKIISGATIYRTGEIIDYNHAQTWFDKDGLIKMVGTTEKPNWLKKDIPTIP